MHAATAAALAVCLAAPARADELPLWELGAGVVGLSVPEYGGAIDRQLHLLPFPYLTYRGRRVQADREGLHFLSNGRLELDVSLDAEPPVVSADGDERAGMPDLLPTVEAGPSVNLVLARNAAGTRALKLRLAGRAVVASDALRWDWLGLVAAPELRLDAVDGRGSKLAVSVGPLFSTQGVHDYTYEVAPAHATMARPAFDATAGYGGTRLLVRAHTASGRVWLGVFARYDYLAGAAFADSPLVRSPHAFAAGTAVAWIFARSARRVDR
jgi:outer membrane scaffolding protein for murein synthesis (MipA/OmpV family)